jgi:hypothetical protein
MVRVRYVRDRIVPSYLDPQDMQWLTVADQLIDLFRAHAGEARGRIEAEIEELFGSLPQPLIHQGLAKLLEDRSEFEVLPGHPPDQLREAVFRAATEQRRRLAAAPGERFSRDQAIAEAAGQLSLEAAGVEAGLFADLKSEQRLVRFKETTPERLLERYNVALAQAVLLRATGVDIVVKGESPQRYRQLLRQVKFNRLICEISKAGKDAYRLQLDGPLSLFSATQKYGLQLALFLPTLLLCRDFQLHAEVRWGAERKEKKFSLTGRDGLVSHQSETGMFVPPEVPMFVELFRKKAADWEISDETEIVALGDRFWVPDFRLTHRPTGGVVLLDVLGFWRKASVDRHLEMLRAHAGRPFLVALSDQLHVEEAEVADIPANVVRFRNLPLADEVAKRALQLIGP